MAAKTVLVTGASGALGQVVCKKFIQSNASVVGTYWGHASENDLTQKMQWLEVNLTEARSVREKLKNQEFDIVVHCAGGFRFAQVENITDEDLDFLIDVNFKSSVYLLRELLPKMKKRNFGRIVLISSRTTLNPGSGMGPYSASKLGLHALVSAIADEVRSYNININAVLPTVIDTPANRSAMPHAQFDTWVPTGELADIIFSLTQEWGRPIQGALIPVSGRV